MMKTTACRLQLLGRMIEKSLDFSFNITYNCKHKIVVMLKGVKNGLQTD